jgi:hypothetical protein
MELYMNLWVQESRTFGTFFCGDWRRSRTVDWLAAIPPAAVLSRFGCECEVVILGA